MSDGYYFVNCKHTRTHYVACSFQSFQLTPTENQQLTPVAVNPKSDLNFPVQMDLLKSDAVN